MSKPIVAVVGRPNVGKSTFFNRVVGRRVSIVEDTPGVTRDRIYAEAEWNGVTFALIDTGGIEPESEDVILSQMREQAQIAMVVEGIYTTDAAYELAQKVGVEMPITECIYNCIRENITAEEAVDLLMGREKKNEKKLFY